MNVDNKGIIKVAYLILAHDNYSNLQHLIDLLSAQNVTFFIHIDAKSKMPKLSSSSDIIFIERQKVYWASFSIVKASLLLLKKAYSKGFDRYVLLSATHLPLLNNKSIIDLLSSDKEFIEIDKGFTSNKPKRRISWFYFDDFNRKNRRNIKWFLIRSIELLISLFYSNRGFDMNNIFHGQQWWALSNNCVTYILNYVDNNPQYIKFFKNSYCPDESFFQTIVGNSTFKTKANHKTTFAIWTEKEKPAILNTEKLKSIPKDETKGFLFARKFVD